MKLDLATTAQIAWRNVWKNKRRSILTMLTIISALSMILFQRGAQNGGYRQMIDDSVSPNVGHIQIHSKGYWEFQSIDYSFLPEAPLVAEIDRLQKEGEITGYTKRIAAGALIVYKSTSTGCLIQGIDPSRESTVTTLHKRILPGGRFVTQNDRDVILLGETLAKNLHVSVGNTIALVSQDMRGSIAAGKFCVIGLLKTLNPEYDRNLALITYKQAIETFDMSAGTDEGFISGSAPNFINSIVIRLQDPDHCGAIAGELKKKVNAEDIEVMTWEDLIPEMVQYIELDKATAWIFIVILYILAAFGVLNTIHMSIFERIREFGIMLAIGTYPSLIIRMVLIESFIITVIGLVIGNGAGWLVCYAVNPIDFSSITEEMQVFGISTTQYSIDIEWWNICNESLIILILSMFFSFFPAFRASRLKPVESIRHL